MWGLGKARGSEQGSSLVTTLAMKVTYTTAATNPDPMYQEKTDTG